MPDDAAALHATLVDALPVLRAQCADPWWLIGSAALRVCGVAGIVVHDVDVLVSLSDAERLLVHWQECIGAGFRPQRCDLFRSRFARIAGFALPLEVMGGLELQRDCQWQPVVPADRHEVQWHRLRVPVPGLAEQCAILEAFGRAKDLAKARVVRGFLRRQHGD